MGKLDEKWRMHFAGCRESRMKVGERSSPRGDVCSLADLTSQLFTRIRIFCNMEVTLTAHRVSPVTHYGVLPRL